MNPFRIPVVACLLAVFIGVCSGAHAQTCRDAIPRTTPDASFVAHPDGTATHKTTGLMWMRCSLGQKWQANSCAGDATGFTWAEALRSSVAHEFAGYTDWRLPNKNELESLVEEACHSPAVNGRIFPQTPTTFFWSSSPYAGLALGAWSVDFGYGSVSASVKTGKFQVRLVRDIRW